MMLKRVGLGAMVAGAGAVASAYAGALFGVPGRWAPWAMVAGITGLALGAMAMGAGGRGRAKGMVVAGLGLVAAILLGGFGIALGPSDPPGALLLGLPPRAAVVVYGIGLIPALILPLVYAAWFTPPRDR